MKQKWLNYVAGGAAGLANGLFGGGGGMVVIPLLSRRLPPEKLYATCVGLIFPVCAVSAGVYLFTGGISLALKSGNFGAEQFFTDALSFIPAK